MTDADQPMCRQKGQQWWDCSCHRTLPTLQPCCSLSAHGAAPSVTAHSPRETHSVSGCCYRPDHVASPDWRAHPKQPLFSVVQVASHQQQGYTTCVLFMSHRPSQITGPTQAHSCWAEGPSHSGQQQCPSSGSTSAAAEGGQSRHSTQTQQPCHLVCEPAAAIIVCCA